MSDIEINKRLAFLAIERMLKSRYFDICTIDKAIKLVGAGGRGTQEYDRLNSLHCRHWSDIPDDILQLMPVWINRVLGGPPVSMLTIPALMEGNVTAPAIEDIRAPMRLDRKR